ncbi:MAG: hypothetical protein K6F52_02535 [Clostridia bacterium]|nr:hypothetical protein [Clostridia bacterium]
MKSKESYFSISLPMFKENLRRFWPISAVGFLLYFFSGIFPLLMSYDNLRPMAGYISNMLVNQNPMFVILNLTMPVITAVMLFAYLHQQASVTSLHAMPFTRAKLFNTYFLSGTVLVLLPMIASGIILLAMAKPVYDENIIGGSVDVSVMTDYFARGDILEWMLQSVIILLFIYVISVFAGMVCGNSSMHAAAALGFNFLVPALYVTIVVYCSMLLYGYNGESELAETTVILTPFLKSLAGEGMFGIKATLGYVIAILAITAISALLYNKRKFEKAGESLVFRFMIPIISYLIAYFGMSLLGFYFREIAEIEKQDIYMFGGFAAGTLIFFVIGRMIVLKTPRVFNKSTLKNLGIYAVIAAVFITSLMCDLTGFEKRVPDFHDVKTAGITIFAEGYENDRFAAHYFKWEDGVNALLTRDVSAFFRDEENIETVAELHREILSNKEAFKDLQVAEGGRDFEIAYDMKAGTDLRRTYSVPLKFYSKSDALAKLFESREFKKHFSFYNIKAKRFSSVTISEAQAVGGMFELATLHESNAGKEIKDIIACLEKDFQARTYSQEVSGVRRYCVLNLGIVENNRDDNGNEIVSYMTVPVLQSDKNTIKWLRDNGYSPLLEITADMIDHVEVRIDGVDNSFADVSDPSQIADLLSTCKESTNSANGIYELTFYMNAKGKQFAANVVNAASAYSSGEIDASKTDEVQLFDGSLSAEMIYYYDADDAPEFIKKLF